MKVREVRDQPAWSRFFLSISIAIVVFTLLVFIALLLRNNSLISRQIRTQAVAHIDQIVKTREWNAHYGGVYVEKKEGIESNPYLDNPDIEAVNGKIYTMKNPALMTREISRLFEEDGAMTFHMTSLKPINPENTPDEFERNALQRFEKGDKEASVRQTIGEATMYRYMVPLSVKEECLQCHAKQGYRLGDIRGGISVTFDITDVARSLRLNNAIILSLGVLSAAALLGFIYAFALSLMKKLDKAQERIKEMAVTDELTGLYNRRFLYSQLREEMARAKRFNLNLSCILLDIDLFKHINDTHGHPAGDLVLKRIAEVVKSCCREIDMVFRYGGEEIVIILIGTDLAGAYRLAAKIRERVESLKCIYEGDTAIRTTVSLGVAAFTHEDLHVITQPDQIIKYADSAMYSAKEKGRNRVEIAETVMM